MAPRRWLVALFVAHVALNVARVTRYLVRVALSVARYIVRVALSVANGACTVAKRGPSMWLDKRGPCGLFRGSPTLFCGSWLNAYIVDCIMSVFPVSWLLPVARGSSSA